jgi:hypothetical protein
MDVSSVARTLIPTTLGRALMSLTRDSLSTRPGSRRAWDGPFAVMSLTRHARMATARCSSIRWSKPIRLRFACGALSAFRSLPLSRRGFVIRRMDTLAFILCTGRFEIGRRTHAESDAPEGSLGPACARLTAAQVYGRSMAGTCGVIRRSSAVMSLAGRSLRGWLGMYWRASCLRCPRTVSFFAGIGLVSGPWQDRADRSCRAGPGIGRESLGCERWPCKSDFQGVTVSGACPAGEYGHRRR